MIDCMLRGSGEGTEGEERVSVPSASESRTPPLALSSAGFCAGLAPAPTIQPYALHQGSLSRMASTIAISSQDSRMSWRLPYRQTRISLHAADQERMCAASITLKSVNVW